jgi:hypothetical protein
MARIFAIFKRAIRSQLQDDVGASQEDNFTVIDHPTDISLPEQGTTRTVNL